MHLWYIEILIRTLEVLSRAVWRRIPRSRWKILLWLRHYLFWVVVILGAIIIAPYRGSLFIAIYAWFRDADDILDGEDPRRPPSLSAFMRTKSRALDDCFSKGCNLPDFRGHDRLLVFIRDLIQKLGIERGASRYMQIIWDHMRTDHHWFESKTIPSIMELDAYARSQDEAIFRLAGLVLSIPPRAFACWNFDTTGVFTHTDWISDMKQDLRGGMIRISQEECGWHTIDRQALMKGLVPQKSLDRLITRRLEHLMPLWKLVNDQRNTCMLSFTNPLLGFFYDRFMIRQFSKVMEKQCRLYDVIYPSVPRN